MPCYLNGRIVIRDIDYLTLSAARLGLIIKENELFYLVYKDGKVLYQLSKPISNLDYKVADDLLKSSLKEYNIGKIKQAARKKGWTISRINEEKGKVKIRVRE